MKFVRFSFSLRTLVLASLLCGAGMMVWRVREAWELRTFHLEKPTAESELSWMPMSHSGEFAILPWAELGDMRMVPVGTVVIDLSDGKVVYKTMSNLTWHATEDLVIARVEPYLKSLDDRKILRMPSGTAVF